MTTFETTVMSAIRAFTKSWAGADVILYKTRRRDDVFIWKGDPCFVYRDMGYDGTEDYVFNLISPYTRKIRYVKHDTPEYLDLLRIMEKRRDQ